MEEFAKDGGRLRIEPRFIEGTIHQLNPAIAGGLIDDEGHMPHAQARMTALLDVAWRPAEAADEEVAQPLFGAGQVVCGIHWPQDVVRGHLRVEGSHEPGEAFLADTRIDLIFGQVHSI